MASLSSPLPQRAPNPSIINTFSNDHASLPGHDQRSEAALSYDFQLFPDDTVGTSPYMAMPSKAVQSIEKRVPQGAIKTSEDLQKEKYRTMLPANPVSEHEHYLAALKSLSPIQSLPAAQANSRCGAGGVALSRSTVELLPGTVHPGIVHASGLGYPTPSSYRSWTQAATKPSNAGSDMRDLYSPPAAPRIERLQTPDLVPMEARAFCDCCTTSGPRKPCELCQKRKVERDFDLFGVGSMFD